MGSFQEKTKLMPRVSAEAGEYVIIETTVKGKVVSEVAVCVTEIGLELVNGINCSRVELEAFNIKGKGVPIRTKITF